MSDFINRHIALNNTEIQTMLKKIGLPSVDKLIKQAIPACIPTTVIKLSKALTETEILQKAQKFANQNKLYTNFIGTGYYGSITPTVIKRNILENSSWYTPYTPYQA